MLQMCRIVRPYFHEFLCRKYGEVLVFLFDAGKYSLPALHFRFHFLSGELFLVIVRPLLRVCRIIEVSYIIRSRQDLVRLQPFVFALVFVQHHEAVFAAHGVYYRDSVVVVPAVEVLTHFALVLVQVVKAFDSDSPCSDVSVKVVAEYGQQSRHGVHPSIDVVSGNDSPVADAAVLERRIVVVGVTVELQHVKGLDDRREAVEPLVMVCKHGGVVVPELLFSFRVDFLFLVGVDSNPDWNGNCAFCSSGSG